MGWMVGDERTETEGLTEDECVLHSCDELLTVLHGMTPCRPPFPSPLSSNLLCISQNFLYSCSASLSLTHAIFATLPFLGSSCSLLSFHKVINEYLRAERSRAPNPFCLGQIVPHGVLVWYSSSNFLIEIWTQFKFSFPPLCSCKWDFLREFVCVIEVVRMDIALHNQ